MSGAKKYRPEVIPTENVLNQWAPQSELRFTKALSVPGALLPPDCICAAAHSRSELGGSALGRCVFREVTPGSALIALKGGTWQ